MERWRRPAVFRAGLVDFPRGREAFPKNRSSQCSEIVDQR